MPLDEIETFYEVNCLDAHTVEERDRVGAINVKEGCDGAAKVGTDFDDALHPCDHSETLDGGLEGFTLSVDEVEFTFVFGKLLSLTMCLNFCNVILADETQNSN